MNRPTVSKCAICDLWYLTDAMCDADVSGHGPNPKVCFSCLHGIEERSQQALHAYEQESEPNEDEELRDGDLPVGEPS